MSTLSLDPASIANLATRLGGTARLDAGTLHLHLPNHHLTLEATRLDFAGTLQTGPLAIQITATQLHPDHLQIDLQIPPPDSPMRL